MRADVRQVADGTYLVHGGHTNWVILTDGDAVTLIDTGYPGDRGCCWTPWLPWGVLRRRWPPC